MTDPSTIEVFRKALMRAHADDWDMDTVAEAAYICAAELGPQPEITRQQIASRLHTALLNGFAITTHQADACIDHLTDEVWSLLADGATPAGAACNGGGTPHPFVPGIDVDDPEHPDSRWCNTCGESRVGATPAEDAQP